MDVVCSVLSFSFHLFILYKLKWHCEYFIFSFRDAVRCRTLKSDPILSSNKKKMQTLFDLKLYQGNSSNLNISMKIENARKNAISPPLLPREKKNHKRNLFHFHFFLSKRKMEREKGIEDIVLGEKKRLQNTSSFNGM